MSRAAGIGVVLLITAVLSVAQALWAWLPAIGIGVGFGYLVGRNTR